MLTALLAGHGIRHAVVCPGSRNAPIIHNLCECDDIECRPVTDERSAGFYAIGMAQASGLPTVVCVTSGTALLNLAPAVAEAYYQKIPLVVVSADRPDAFIGQLDGQTLPQNDALGAFVRKKVCVREFNDDTGRWHCCRLINEALMSSVGDGGGPVHINMPVSEPLFEFTATCLPEPRVLSMIAPATDCRALERKLLPAFTAARSPMVVVGQMKPDAIDAAALKKLSANAVIISETLGCAAFATHFDEAVYALDGSAAYQPDFILYIGGTIVSKRLKSFLRCAGKADVWRVDEDGGVHDTFMNLGTVVHGKPADVINMLADIHVTEEHACFVNEWNDILERAARHTDDFQPAFSQMSVVRYFEEQLADMDYDFHVHYANSSAVRLANIYADHHVYCNRGVNGIEGCLSVAAGHSLLYKGMVFCVIGDLSFFYDQNAMWNANIGGNLRIILLNNGCGGIFYQLKGLSGSNALHKMIAAGHGATAQGICTQNDIGYMKADNDEEMQIGMVTLLTSSSNRPMLLEVFTDAQEDAKVLEEYYRTVNIE